MAHLFVGTYSDSNLISKAHPEGTTLFFCLQMGALIVTFVGGRLSSLQVGVIVGCLTSASAVVAYAFICRVL